MDWETASPLIVSVIANLGALVLTEIGRQLIALVFVVYVLGSLMACAVAALGWRSIRRVILDLHAPRHRPAH